LHETVLRSWNGSLHHFFARECAGPARPRVTEIGACTVNPDVLHRPLHLQCSHVTPELPNWWSCNPTADHESPCSYFKG